MSTTESIIAPRNKDVTQKALILAGGGVRLAYQAGVLQALQEAKLQFTHVDGTSGGIFNTAMLASGLGPDEMGERWRKLKIKYFMSGMPVKSYLKPLRMMAFGDADGIRKNVFPSLGIDLEKIRNNQEIIATFNVCNYADKSVESIPHHQVTEDHLIAGMSLPIFMPAIKINNDWYSDAVWIKDANLMEAVKRGAEEIWLVWAIGNHSEYLPGFFNQYVHMIEMSANGGLLEEYAQINTLNQRIIQGDSPYGQKTPIRLHVIRPEYPLPLDPDLFFNKIDTPTLINKGYDDAKNYLAKMQENGVPYDAVSTKMQNPGITLSFRQHFTGQLKFDGEQSAIAFHPAFTLHRWENKLLLEFVSSIYIETLGREISTKNNVASIIQEQNTIFIRTTSAFQHAGQEYKLQGEIKLGSQFDWLLGLEFKQIRLQIIRIKNGEKSVVLKGELTQNIRNRFKYLFGASLGNFYGPGWKIKEKYSMISKLYQHEI